MEQKDYLPNIIGLQKTKRTLNFYLDSFQKTKFIKPILLCGEKGGGKTKLARSLARNLVDVNNNPRPLVEINGASIKNLRGFIDTVVIPYNNAEVTFFLDEIHSISLDTLNWLLTVLQFQDDNAYVTQNDFDGIAYSFDFRRTSFIAATTNSEQIPAPLQSRLKKIELEKYTHEELREMLNRRLKIKFIENSDSEIVNCSRSNPRILLEQIGADIKIFCQNNKINYFGKKHWDSLRYTLDIKPFGLSRMEIQELEYLSKYNNSSLRSVAAYLGLESRTVMNDCELFLLRNAFIRIDGKRQITAKGLEAYKQVLAEN